MVCSKCKVEKNIDEFTKRTNGKYRSECKDCRAEYMRHRKKTKDGLITKIYSSQKINSKKRNHSQPEYTNKQLNKWCKKQKLFHALYDNWVLNNYKINLTPSIDRIDNSIGYSFSNIQLMTWEQNNIKEKNDRKNGIDNRTNKAVLQYDKKLNFMHEYHSIRDASRKTNVHVSNIGMCCNKKRKTAGGFVWKFKDKFDIIGGDYN